MQTTTILYKPLWCKTDVGLNWERTQRACCPCGGVKTPPYNVRERPYEPASKRRGTVLRAAYMPPLRIDRTRPQPKKRHHRTNGYGPHTCGPYGPRETPYKPYMGSRGASPYGGVKTPPYRARQTLGQTGGASGDGQGVGGLYAALQIKQPRTRTQKRCHMQRSKNTVYRFAHQQYSPRAFARGLRGIAVKNGHSTI